MVEQETCIGDLTMFFIRGFIIAVIVCLNYVKCADIRLEPPIVQYSFGETVSMTCMANLTDDEVNTTHWFTWTRNGVTFAENFTGMFHNNRYQIRGDSSAQMTEISQNLNILHVNETDHGEYHCILNFKPTLGVYTAEALVIIKDYIPEPQCNYMTTNVNRMQVTLCCSSQPGNPPITLELVRNDDESFLMSKKQFEYAQLELDYQYNVGDEESWLNFTCKSSNNQAMNDAKECHIFLNIEELNWDLVQTTLEPHLKTGLEPHLKTSLEPHLKTTLEPHLHTNTGDEVTPDEVKPDEVKPDEVTPDKVYIITFATGFGILFVFIIMLCVYCRYLKTDVNNVNNNMRNRIVGKPSDEWGRCDLSAPQLNNNAVANVYKQHVELEKETKALGKDVKSESTGSSIKKELGETKCNLRYKESILESNGHISVENQVCQCAANVYKQHVELEEKKVLSKEVKSESNGSSIKKELAETKCNTGYKESIVQSDDHVSVENPVYQSLET